MKRDLNKHVKSIVMDDIAHLISSIWSNPFDGAVLKELQRSWSRVILSVISSQSDEKHLPVLTIGVSDFADLRKYMHTSSTMLMNYHSNLFSMGQVTLRSLGLIPLKAGTVQTGTDGYQPLILEMVFTENMFLNAGLNQNIVCISQDLISSLVSKNMTPCLKEEKRRPT